MENKKIDLDKMSEYWDSQADDDAMLHIAHSTDVKQFNERGTSDMEGVLDNHLKHFMPLKDLKVLDVGCGIGRLLLPLSKMNITKSMVGVDVSGEMIEQGKEYCKGADIHLEKNNGADLQNLKDNSFNFVFSKITFQHIPRPLHMNYFKEIWRVLEPNGIFIVQLASKEVYLRKYKKENSIEPPDSNYRSLRLYSDEDIKELIKEFSSKFKLLMETPRRMLVLQKKVAE